MMAADSQNQPKWVSKKSSDWEYRENTVTPVHYLDVVEGFIGSQSICGS